MPKTRKKKKVKRFEKYTAYGKDPAERKVAGLFASGIKEIRIKRKRGGNYEIKSR